MKTLYLTQEIIECLIEMRFNVISIKNVMLIHNDESEIIKNTLAGYSKKGKTLTYYPFDECIQIEMLNWQDYIEAVLESAEIIYVQNNKNDENLSLIKIINDNLENLIKNLIKLRKYVNKSQEFKDIFSKPIKLSISEEINSVFTKGFTLIINDITRFKEVFIEELKENLGVYYFDKLTT